MDQRIDLDLAAAEIERRRVRWTQGGFVVGELTWRDVGSAWPYPLVARADAAEPDSVGVRCARERIEFSVVLFAGGWADVEGANLGKATHETSAPDVPDAAAFGELLDETFARWSKEAPGK